MRTLPEFFFSSSDKEKKRHAVLAFAGPEPRFEEVRRIGKRVLASRCRQDRCVLRSGRVGRSLKKPRSPFSDSGPLAAAQTSFLLKELRRRRPKRLDPPSAARLADLRRARRGEAEFQVILPTRPFQISVLSKTSLKRFGERYFDPPDDDKEKTRRSGKPVQGQGSRLENHAWLQQVAPHDRLA